MEVRVELEFFEGKLNVETRKEYYEKYHAEDGVLFDDESEAIYYVVDLPCVPTEGQRVGTRWGVCIVLWAIWELEDYKSDRHFDKTRIFVREE